MKKKVALITGGYSEEAQVSYKSAYSVAKALDTTKYEVYLIDINKKGWTYKTNTGAETEVDKNDFSIILNNKKLQFDIALVCIHGTPAEDGKLLGYFDMIGLPYTCCSALVSALTFNKKYTVALAEKMGIPTAKSVLIYKDKPFDEEAVAKLQFPIFVKPNNGGSSLATSKVLTIDDLHNAIDNALAVDSEVLIEEFIQGREFTIGVFKENGKIQLLPISEVVMNVTRPDSFFDFEAKYSGKTEEITPADITNEIKKVIEKSAYKLYDGLNCAGVVRIDFIYSEEQKKAYMLEINTIPGQTSASFIPQQVRASGRSVQDFYTTLIEEALK